MPTRAKSLPIMRLSGTVLGFNLSAKGDVEGALIATPRGQEQINFPRHLASAMARAVHVGADIDVDVELEFEAGIHRVYRLREFDCEARGVVVRLNYEVHGNVDGYHLDDATFLYVTRLGAQEHDVRVGETVRATGGRCAGADAVVFEVRTLERVKRIGKRHDEGTVG